MSRWIWSIILPSYFKTLTIMYSVNNLIGKTDIFDEAMEYK